MDSASEVYRAEIDSESGSAQALAEKIKAVAVEFWRRRCGDCSSRAVGRFRARRLPPLRPSSRS